MRRRISEVFTKLLDNISSGWNTSSRVASSSDCPVTCSIASCMYKAPTPE